MSSAKVFVVLSQYGWNVVEYEDCGPICVGRASGFESADEVDEDVGRRVREQVTVVACYF